jgi:hypothetical protein
MPCTIAHIWLWSLPLICALILLYYFLYSQKYLVFILLLICSVCTLLNQLGLACYDNEYVGVVSDKKDSPVDGVSLCALNNMTNEGSLSPLEDARNNISLDTVNKKWIISLVSTPSLNPEWLRKNALSGEYYIFAEHDNMSSFIGSDSPFNSDAFHRKGPWSVYKPVMNPGLFNSSEQDVLYCSNIGCTLKKDSSCYPLVWSYTKFGTPILLAKGEFNKGRRFVYIGDSDPMGDFLAPYNPFWMRSLLGKPNYFEIISAIFVFVFAFYTKIGRCSELHKSSLYALPLLVLAFCVVGRLQCDIRPVVDVSISATDKWLSPHYPFRFSSMPKKLTQDNLTVAVERKKSTSILDIKIISQTKYKVEKVSSRKKYDIRFLILLPGASIITPSGNVIMVDDVPLGRKVIPLEHQKKLVINDARNLIVNGKHNNNAVFSYGNTYIMSTGSPQKIEGIYDFVYSK